MLRDLLRNHHYRSLAMLALLLLIGMAAVAYGSLRPLPAGAQEMPLLAAVGALLPIPGYMLLSALWMRFLRLFWRRRRRPPVLLVSWVIMAGAAGLLEMLQRLSATRRGAWSDFFFYAAAALLPAVLALFLPVRRQVSLDQLRPRDRFARPTRSHRRPAAANYRRTVSTG